jgi:hypothetical protein
MAEDIDAKRAKFCCYCGISLESVNASVCCQQCGNDFVSSPDALDDLPRFSSQEVVAFDGIDSQFETLVRAAPHERMCYRFIESLEEKDICWYRLCDESDGSFIMGASKLVSSSSIQFHDIDYLNSACVYKMEAYRQRKEVLNLENYGSLSFRSNFAQDMIIKIPSKSSQSDIEIGLLQSTRRESAKVFKATVRPDPFSKGATVPLESRLLSQVVEHLNPSQTMRERVLGGGPQEYVNLRQNDDTENDDDEIVTFESFQPTWNGKINQFCLDFNGRALEACPKNFILIPCLEEKAYGNVVSLRCGKVSRNRRNMDYRFPFSPLTAFATCLSTEMVASLFGRSVEVVDGSEGG